MNIIKKSFGATPDGFGASLYTMTNKCGASVSVSDLGGILVSLCVPDRNGNLTDVLLGYNSIAGYFPNVGYLGALIGRVGNRIANGSCSLDGHALLLNKNENNTTHLHGGLEGFNTKVWKVTQMNHTSQLVLEYTSLDGEENYPGKLHVKVTYGFSEDNALSIHYTALSDKDTLCNLTNHAYFNLGGEGSGTILDNEISISADYFTPVDAACIPTGEIRSVEGTVMDLRTPVRIGDGLTRGMDDIQMTYGSGYDHNFCLNGAGLRQVATVFSQNTGITMTVDTDQPGIQFYSANHLKGVNPGKCGRVYAPHDGLCLETQNYPDAINHPNFPNAILKAGHRYDTTTIYRFTTND